MNFFLLEVLVVVTFPLGLFWGEYEISIFCVISLTRINIDNKKIGLKFFHVECIKGLIIMQ